MIVIGEIFNARIVLIAIRARMRMPSGVQKGQNANAQWTLKGPECECPAAARMRIREIFMISLL